ncbi:MAG: serine/threonine protein kinase, partial [Acidobacteria bacterium]|nr:serine/threonine protein kinase [Acidobacteriota bacterium]
DVVERGEEGLAFIAMEYVRGTNLKSLLQEPERPTLTFVSEILAQIADGLDYAHSCKVIHRDIKPANILITKDNRAKITDFGIARLDTSNLTQEGQLLGTPNYMSPEQILGRDVDHRADIFSLGVVLYEMVTRHKPFQGENLTVVSHRIVYDHFTPLREYADDLPPGTEQILAKALEKDPGRRYQRARDMAEDLRRVLGSVGVRDTLNETQSLSTTAMLPAHLRAAAPPLQAAAAAAPLAVVPDPQPGPAHFVPPSSSAAAPGPLTAMAAARAAEVPLAAPAAAFEPAVIAGAFGAPAPPAARLVAASAAPAPATPAAPAPSAPSAPAAAAEAAEAAGAAGAAAAAPAPRPASRWAPSPASPPSPSPSPAPAAEGAPAWPHATRPVAVPQELAGAASAPAGAGRPEAAPVPPSVQAVPEPAAVGAPPPRATAPRAARGLGGGLLAMPSPARLVTAVAAGLGVGLLLAGGMFLWTRSAQPAAPLGTVAAARPEASQATRLQVLALVRDGRRRLDAGDADGAAAAFRAAEQQMPGRRALRQLREEAERRQGDRRRRIDQERAIEAKLDEGRLALADRRYPEAETAAQAVLAMSPGNTVAEEILASVKEGRTRSKDRTAAATARQQARAVAAAPPAVRPEVAPRTDQPSPTAAVETKDATLELGFFSELPEGSLLIYVNGRKVLGESFRFYEKSGFLRSHPSTGWVRRSFHLPAGNVEIRLYVTPHGSAAIVRTIPGNLAGGSSRRLDVKLTEGGDVAAQLN